MVIRMCLPSTRCRNVQRLQNTTVMCMVGVHHEPQSGTLMSMCSFRCVFVQMKWWTRLLAMPHVAQHVIPAAVRAGVIRLAVDSIRVHQPQYTASLPGHGTCAASDNDLLPAACIVLLSMMSSRSALHADAGHWCTNGTVVVGCEVSLCNVKISVLHRNSWVVSHFET